MADFIRIIQKLLEYFVVSYKRLYFVFILFWHKKKFLHRKCCLYVVLTSCTLYDAFFLLGASTIFRIAYILDVIDDFVDLFKKPYLLLVDEFWHDQCQTIDRHHISLFTFVIHCSRFVDSYWALSRDWYLSFRYFYGICVISLLYNIIFIAHDIISSCMCLSTGF